MGEAWEGAGVEGFGDGLDALMEEARAPQADLDGLDGLMDGAGLDAPWDPEDMAALGGHARRHGRRIGGRHGGLRGRVIGQFVD